MSEPRGSLLLDCFGGLGLLCMPLSLFNTLRPQPENPISALIEGNALLKWWTVTSMLVAIPLALADAADDGRLEPGNLVLMTGMGAGLTWGSALIEWTHVTTGANGGANG